MVGFGKITEDQKVLMVELYASGESTAKIGQRLQVSDSSVNIYLHRLGVVLRGPRPKRQIRHDAFGELTPDAAYWIGFLFADGSVGRGERLGRVSIRVSE